MVQVDRGGEQGVSRESMSVKTFDLTRLHCRIVEKMIDPPEWAHKPNRLFDASKHISPPYLTAKPGTTMRSLESSDKPQGNLKFIIAASDGRACFLPIIL